MASKQARASPDCQQCYEQHRHSRNQHALFRRRLWRSGSERRFADDRLGSRNHGRWWRPLEPVTKGLTNLGPAFRLVAEALAPGRIERRALRPALLLITDGLATDPPGAFEDGLAALMGQAAGRAALRLSVAIGRDAQSDALNRFIGDPTVPVLVADNTEEIADRLVAASLAVSRMSAAGADRSAVARRLLGLPDGTTTGIFSQDTIV